jgi:hypothetical protein
MQADGGFNYTGGDWPLRMRGSRVTWQWFEVFEAKPLMGRVFASEEDQPGADHEVVLSYNAWKSTFGGDTKIVGRSIQLNQEPYQIIGVMGPDFLWPNPTDLWAPLGLKPEAFAIDNLFNESYFVVARLQPNVRFASATAYLNLVTQQIWDDPRAQGYPRNSGWGIFAVPFTEFVYGDLRTPLLILLGAVGFVLLIACSNVAGLLLARSLGRSKEFAVRTALGASPWRLAGQTPTESAGAAAAGMVVGLEIALAVARAIDAGNGEPGHGRGDLDGSPRPRVHGAVGCAIGPGLWRRSGMAHRTEQSAGKLETGPRHRWSDTGRSSFSRRSRGQRISVGSCVAGQHGGVSEKSR